VGPRAHPGLTRGAKKPRRRGLRGLSGAEGQARPLPAGVPPVEVGRERDQVPHGAPQSLEQAHAEPGATSVVKTRPAWQPAPSPLA
jgi:hypothetical protein